MAQSRTRVLLLACLTLLIGASLWRTVAVEREKRQLAEAYARARQLVAQLAEERNHLSDEFASASHAVEMQAGDLQSIQHELKSVQQRLNETMIEIASLQREHEMMRQENAALTTELDSTKTEKQRLEAKLSSLKELRLAMRDVTRKMRTERWLAWRANVERMKDEDRERLASGNRGYLVRDGASTMAASPRLHVHVLEPQSQ